MYVPERGGYTNNNFGGYYGPPQPLTLLNLSLTLDLADLDLLPELWETLLTELVDNTRPRLPIAKKPPVLTQPMFHLPGNSLLWSTPALTPKPPINLLEPINPLTIYTYNYYGTIATLEDKLEEALIAGPLRPLHHMHAPAYGPAPLHPPKQTLQPAPPAPLIAKEKLVNTQLYKTELCALFMKNGVCPYSNTCQFAHGENELKQVERPPKWRLKPCTNWQKYGKCRYGNRCLFKHGDD